MEIEINKLDNLGRGIGYINGKIIFIPKALSGEKVLIEITKETKKYYEGKLLKVLESSSKRIESKCKYFNVCGGCNLFNIRYEDTLLYKEEKLREVLKKFSNISNININIVSSIAENYRNKVVLHIKDGKVGLYDEDNNITEINNCLIVNQKINEIIKKIGLFNIKNGDVKIRVNNKEDIILSINSNDKISIIEDKNVKGIVLNGELIYGKDYFNVEIYNYIFKVSYNSFFQVNPFITDKLFNIIEKNITETDVVGDLYCGVGTLGVVASKKAKNVIGIDNLKDNIDDALINKEINRINNIEFVCNDASNILNYKDINTIIVDPPRSGLNSGTIENITSILPNKIIYISCNPITLSRDLNVLLNAYSIKEINMLDMFPFTHHVETVCILEKK